MQYYNENTWFEIHCQEILMKFLAKIKNLHSM